MAVLSTAVADKPGMSDAQRTRYHDLTSQLRCLICQNRSIAESDAPLAADLRALVARQIEAGRSDTEIKQYLVDRYGEWVLYDPPFNIATWLLWLGPFVLLLFALAVALGVLRTRRQSASSARRIPDRDRLAAVLNENPDERTRQAANERDAP
ncbi:C-type cytochrome biogenesis protein CcmH [Salinisphaera hydrothermalis EPR70]